MASGPDWAAQVGAIAGAVSAVVVVVGGIAAARYLIRGTTTVEASAFSVGASLVVHVQGQAGQVPAVSAAASCGGSLRQTAAAAGSSPDEDVTAETVGLAQSSQGPSYGRVATRSATDLRAPV